MCRRTEEEVGPTVGLPRHRHFVGFFNVPVLSAYYIYTKEYQCLQMPYNYLRIEVHFFGLYFEMKGQWSRVNLAKRF